jgi:hypothetical protein
MQSLSVLLTALSCGTYFEGVFPSCITCVKTLVSWLRLMATTNDIARRAFGVVKSIVHIPVKQGPSFWMDIAALFPEEEDVVREHVQVVDPALIAGAGPELGYDAFGNG